jgi:hypothetical protein
MGEFCLRDKIYPRREKRKEKKKDRRVQRNKETTATIMEKPKKANLHPRAQQLLYKTTNQSLKHS